MSKTKKQKKIRYGKKGGSSKTIKNIAKNLVDDYTNQAMKNISVQIKKDIAIPKIKENKIDLTNIKENKQIVQNTNKMITDTNKLSDFIKQIPEKDDIKDAVEEFKEMLDNGADPNGKTYFEKRPPLIICIYYLQHAIEHNDEIFNGKKNTTKYKKYYTKLINILLDPKYNVDASLVDENGETALILACGFELENIANKLLARTDSNPCAISKYKKNAFMYACSSRMSSVALKLLDVCPSIVNYGPSKNHIWGEIKEKFDETKKMLENAKNTENTENANV